MERTFQQAVRQLPQRETWSGARQQQGIEPVRQVFATLLDPTSCGRIWLQESYIEPEGLKRRKFWTFNIRDATGASLIRLSTESQADYGRWLDALEQAGCERVRAACRRCRPCVQHMCTKRARALKHSTMGAGWKGYIQAGRTTAWCGLLPLMYILSGPCRQ